MLTDAPGVTTASVTAIWLGCRPSRPPMKAARVAVTVAAPRSNRTEASKT